MSIVPTPLNLLEDDVFRNGLEVVCPPHPGKKVNEGCGEVVPVRANLCGFIVPGEAVVVVVPPFSRRDDGDELVFGRVYPLVIGPEAPEMSRTVDEPRGVKGEDIPGERNVPS